MKEPAKRTFHIFHSFEEARAFEDEFAANQDPLERMAATLRVIKAVYDYKPRTPDAPRTFVLQRLY